jgi:molybdate transport system substrate-binding protein
MSRLKSRATRLNTQAPHKILVRILASIAIFAAAFIPLQASAKSPEQPLRVYAAASLTDAFNDISALYTAAGHPAPVFNFAASSVLAKQIDQGAGADLFASADEAWMDYLNERKLVDPKTRTSFLSNKLVLIAPIDHPLTVTIKSNFDLKGALNGGKLAMADPDSVPAGKYGKAALQSLGVWESVSGSVVRGENVRAALRFVEVGEAPAGIVYLTDAMASKKVSIAGEFPQVSYPRISYPIAAVRSGNVKEAKAFEAFLQTDAAIAVFKKRGFIIQ